jgi:hypothetical protein
MIRDGKKSRAFVRKSGINPLDPTQVSCDKGASTGHNARMEGNKMARTIEQNAADMEIALMRMNQARDKLADAVIAGDNAAIERLEKVHAAAIWDFRDLRAERRYMDRYAA